jgi:putative ABC transport system permease protein
MTPYMALVESIEQGTVRVGHELGIGLKEGDTVEIEGPGETFSFRVAEVYPESGTQQDVTLALHLHDAQKVLDKAGKISQIMALGCHCKEAELSNIREQLATVLPDTRIQEHLTRRIARAKQRDQVAAARRGVYDEAAAEEKQQLEELTEHRQRVQGTLEAMVDVITPLVVLVCAAFVGLMSWNNVRERWAEIGILRAIGKGGSMIAALFLGKAITVGLIGGAVGCVLGILLARAVGGTMETPAEFFRPSVMVIAATIAGAPLVAALASYLPTLSAVRQDPAIVLQDQ